MNITTLEQIDKIVTDALSGLLPRLAVEDLVGIYQSVFKAEVNDWKTEEELNEDIFERIIKNI